MRQRMGAERRKMKDVRKLSRTHCELVVKQALATNDQDNYRLLAGIKERFDRVQLEVPKIEVRYQNLNVEADVQTGSRALPTLINCTRDVFEVHFGFLYVNHCSSYHQQYCERGSHNNGGCTSGFEARASAIVMRTIHSTVDARKNSGLHNTSTKH